MITGERTLIGALVLGVGLALGGWFVGHGFAVGRGTDRFVTVKGADLHDSVHGADNSWQALECADCHENDADPHEPVTVNSSREYSLQQNQACSRCHEENFQKAEDSVHAIALEEGVQEAAVCIDCHGAHDTLKHSEDDARLP